MAQKIQFKNPDSVLVTQFMGKITNENITQEKYEALLKLNPVHAEMFEVKEVEETPLFINVNPKTAAQAEVKNSKSKTTKE